VKLPKDVAAIPGSARESRAGFGGSPKSPLRLREIQPLQAADENIPRNIRFSLGELVRP
jgi:hypothetical protein